MNFDGYEACMIGLFSNSQTAKKVCIKKITYHNWGLCIFNATLGVLPIQGMCGCIGTIKS
jgi:hypothetical protein